MTWFIIGALIFTAFMFGDDDALAPILFWLAGVILLYKVLVP